MPKKNNEIKAKLADTFDKYDLYEESVQCSEAEVDFIEEQFFEYNSINYFAENLSYSSDYKILYLLFIVICVALLYFLICYFLKVFNLRSFKTN